MPSRSRPRRGRLIFTRLAASTRSAAASPSPSGSRAPSLDVEPRRCSEAMAIEAESGDAEALVPRHRHRVPAGEGRGPARPLRGRARPWLWLLGLTYDCRIFQNLSVVEIVEEIFGKYPEASSRSGCRAPTPPREYCVQYDESDLDFVQRLMEHEGIFYFFEYAEDGHTLVLADAMAKLKPRRGLRDRAVPRRGPPRPAATATSSRIGCDDSVRPGLRPHRLRLREARPFADGAVGREPAPEASPASTTASPAPTSTRPRRRGRGDPPRGTAGAACADPRRRHGARPRLGARFTLGGFPREDQNVEHLVLRADYRMVDPEFRPRRRAGGRHLPGRAGAWRRRRCPTARRG